MAMVNNGFLRLCFFSFSFFIGGGGGVYLEGFLKHLHETSHSASFMLYSSLQCVLLMTCLKSA